MRSAIALTLVLGGCGDPRDSPSPPANPAGSSVAPAPAASAPPAIEASPPPARASSTGFCAHEVSGAITGAGRSPGGPSTFASDHFFDEQELRAALEIVTPPAKLEAVMQGDPRIAALLIHCSGFLSFSIVAGHEMKLADVPFGPKKYAMGAKPKQFTALVESARGDFIASAGELDVQTFDRTGLKGAFRFTAKNVDRAEEIVVKGTFDLPCVLPTKLCGT